ncbi:hypothetical protein K493DRAFT_337710 [Basidiobolus meristosporus CBS 931.73]|uniref:Arrestin C-terminal-like domain-containing protein n=1 Tax=Basidiobolus meristosporus CBS 931.73 TaxID=1314790 RepID=A0A1Y1Y9D5_9FUNG|nr:hypothetical protein K493DRAFT_337710 [Basidiobolus meristosporus CBS 931.73]|eukprot:ORX94621.1 hypothetical protein K493DRAFT_337710 [Basidiobolus meristosporus CBS 931.73]
MTKTLFQIQTAQEIFYHDLHNWQRDPVIRGNLLLFPSRPLSIRQIRLRFVGRVHIKYTYQRFEKVLVEKMWNFLPEDGPTYTFAPQAHSIGFHFEFPGELPESLQAAHGRIEYALHATAITSLFKVNLHTKKIIPVRRILGPILGADYSTRCQGSRQGLVEYAVSIPTLEYSHGDHIQVDFKIHLPQMKVKPKFVACGLREHTVYRIPMDQCNTQKYFKESWVMATVESYRSDEAEVSLHMRVPQSPEEIHCSYRSEYVEISHFVYGQIQFPGVNVQVGFPVLITNKMVATPALPPAYSDSHLQQPPSYPSIPLIAHTTKPTRRMSIHNPIAILSH